MIFSGEKHFSFHDWYGMSGFSGNLSVRQLFDPQKFPHAHSENGFGR